MFNDEHIHTCIRHCDEQWDALKAKVRNGQRIKNAEAMLTEIHNRRTTLILELQRRHGDI